ncbi:MAG: class I SAM-dependent methyltransferase, partial [Pseudomonadota bacterium]
HLWILDELRPFLGKHLLEVGAGSGDFSKLLLQTQTESLTAIEPSKNMFPLLEETLKHQSECSGHNIETFNAFFGDVYQSLSTQPDTIIYVNVLEHISDDKSELTYVYRSLPVGGHVCIFVPALQWLYGTADTNFGHFRRYYKKPLESIVESIGFKIVKSRYFDIAGILPWWLLFCLLKRQSVKANQVAVYDKIVVPIMRRLEAKIPLAIGKNILIVGKKQ